MKKIFTRAMLVVGVFCSAAVISVSAAEGNIQDEFLADMANGLNSRWEAESDESTMSSSEIMEYRAELVNKEYSSLSKYESETFENQKFDLMAHAYIEAIEMQANAVKYYIELPGIYETEWAAGYNLRASLIPAFVDYYGLDVPEEDVAVFRDGNSVAVSAETGEKPETLGNDSAIADVPEIELFNNEGIRVTMTGIVEATLDYTKIKVKIENLNHKDVMIGTADYQMVINGNMTQSPLYAEVKSGKTADTTMDFYHDMLKEDGIDEIKEMSFAIQVVDAESFATLYIGEEKFLTVDDEGQISEKAVYTDKENIQKVQELLNQAGYDCGSADGVPGKKTNNALLEFERDHGIPETTDITPELIEALEAAIE